MDGIITSPSYAKVGFEYMTCRFPDRLLSERVYVRTLNPLEQLITGGYILLTKHLYLIKLT